MPKAAVDIAGAAGAYTVYAAGGMFTQHELTTNVLLKEAVWRLSGGRFELVLPQSKELRDVERPDLATHIRNVDLLQVVETDMILARFDGLELDSGTVVEFMLAKSLGKPAVILRSDFRGLTGEDMEDPYNLMVKGWPRTVEVHVDSLRGYTGEFTAERGAHGDDEDFAGAMNAELIAAQRGVDAFAQQIIAGLTTAVQMESPYPSAYRELIYRALRHSLGSGFDELLTAEMLEEIIQRLSANRTL